MGRVVVLNHLTLDGVMQAPGRPDEDPRDGFPYGGWAVPRGDAVMEAFGGLREVGGLLFGRRTYEDFFGFWPHQMNNPFTAMLDTTQKYLLSSTMTEPLPWQNSTLLHGDVADAVALLKDQREKDLLIMGSGVLIQSLMRRNLIDTYILLIHPIVLGTGRRLFPQGTASTTLRLVAVQSTASGVLIATYQPDKAVHE